MSNKSDPKFDNNVHYSFGITSTSIARKLCGQWDEYGNNRGNLLVISTMISGLGIRLELDYDIVETIAVGYGLNDPNFGIIGEKFLKSKIPDPNKRELGAALLKHIFYNTPAPHPRLDRIIEGTERLCRGEEPRTDEEKLVLGYTTAQKFLSQFKTGRNFWPFRTLIIDEGILEASRKAGTVVYPSVEEMTELAAMHPELTKLSPTPTPTEKALLLEQYFQHYKTNKDQLFEEFAKTLPDYHEDAVIAYYVMTLPLH